MNIILKGILEIRLKLIVKKQSHIDKYSRNIGYLIFPRYLKKKGF